MSVFFTMKVQSVLFPRSMSMAACIAWLKDNGLSHYTHRETAGYIRFRQYHPHPDAKYVTKDLAHGIKLILEL